MIHLLVLSLLASNVYNAVSLILDVSLLTQLGFNNSSSIISINGYNISEIDPNAFKGYNQVTSLSFSLTALI